jgi:lipopolysaccharide/colanic/teichoic acid biosynthesis glycosyltransferase
MQSSSAMLKTLQSARDSSQSVFCAWNLSLRKRSFDFICASLLLILSSPVLLIVALLLKCTSGAVFFSQERVGKAGVLFHLLKFRTMSADAKKVGPSLTRSGDSRITQIGRVLRRWKIDELPQLINVVRGDMSLVGPRPDVPKYIRELTNEQRRVLTLLPGITGAASLVYHQEEVVLAKIPEELIEEYYCAELLPAKVALDMEYAQRASFFNDLIILLKTARRIFW